MSILSPLASAIVEKYTPPTISSDVLPRSIPKHHLDHLRRPSLEHLKVVSLHGISLKLAKPPARLAKSNPSNPSNPSEKPTVDLASVCPRVQEADLRDIRHLCWNALTALCAAWPSLEHLDLSNAAFPWPSPSVEVVPLSRSLRVLVLNNADVEWHHIPILARLFPDLTQIVLCANHLSPGFIRDPSQLDHLAFHPEYNWPNLQTISLSTNNLETIEPLAVLCRSGLSALARIILLENPIRSLPLTQQIPSLVAVNLASTAMGSWDDLESIAFYSALSDIRITNTPLATLYSDSALFRALVIARLPQITVLNGSAVTEKEREDAERRFIRYYDPDLQRDAEIKTHVEFFAAKTRSHLQRLTEKHGKLEPLAVVSLEPPKEVSILLQCDGKQSILKTLSVYTSAREIKDICSKLFDIQPKHQTLYFEDVGAKGQFGIDRISIPTRTLAQLNARDGDIILCEDKTKLPNYRPPSDN
eukprot:TRINITY_DN3227_c0_g1_i1.p1 TRINITY_DN3227_c0_g1~~TRINITY_DN3227_c0_g1_i1.p1  ORF type:complete len:474 (-),score=108.43 TRINITY_DN3227_c0_g1_i1:781-2202(-)